MPTIEEVAEESGHPLASVLSWTDRLKIRPQRDWAGRSALEEQDAARVLDAIRAASQESAELHQAHELYMKDWERQRHEAGEAAFNAALEEAFEHQLKNVPGPEQGYASYTGALIQPMGPQTYVRANQIAAEARDEFKRKNPMQTFEQFSKQWRKRRR